MKKNRKLYDVDVSGYGSIHVESLTVCAESLMAAHDKALETVTKDEVFEDEHPLRVTKIVEQRGQLVFA